MYLKLELRRVLIKYFDRAQINNIDIMPTIFDYLGFECPEGTQRN